MSNWLRAATLSAGLVVYGAAAAQAASVLFFDDFEAETLGRNAELTRWNVTAGAVDVIGAGGSYDWFPGNGLYVDLDGSQMLAGRIETKRTFDLVLGGAYRLSFDYAKNGERAETLSFGVGSAGSQIGIAKGYWSGWKTHSGEFRAHEFAFVALETRATIFFAAAGTDNRGPILDNVELFGPLAPLAPAPAQVVATPVPPAALLLFSAVSGVWLAGRARRRT